MTRRQGAVAQAFRKALRPGLRWPWSVLVVQAHRKERHVVVCSGQQPFQDLVAELLER